VLYLAYSIYVTRLVSKITPLGSIENKLAGFSAKVVVYVWARKQINGECGGMQWFIKRTCRLMHGCISLIHHCSLASLH
jgi:hypothetical protein